jgi:hemolysin activation/secretion protein
VLHIAFSTQHAIISPHKIKKNHLDYPTYTDYTEQLEVFMGFNSKLLLLCTSVCTLMSAGIVAAQEIPSAADASRVPFFAPTERLPVGRSVSIPEIIKESKAPANAEHVTFLLKKVTIQGASLFSEEQLTSLYAELLNKTVSLKTIWLISAKITELYRSHGYFLSYSFVPAQELTNGAVQIRVVEGAIGKVEIEGNQADKNHAIIQKMAAKLIANSPLTTAQLESFMLRLNDLPEHQWFGSLEASDDNHSGKVTLRLTPHPKKTRAVLSLNRNGSRFLGPVQWSGYTRFSPFTTHETSVSVSSSLPADELKYISGQHLWHFAPRWKAGVLGSYVRTKPGHSLRSVQMEGDSTEIGAKLHYQAIRQRQKNLGFTVQVDSRNTNGDTLGTALTRDRSRNLRAMMDYDGSDRWQAQNSMNLTLSKGLALLGSSEAGDRNLSRAEGEPDYSKVEVTATRQQLLTGNWLLTSQLRGQAASAPLLSSEEFGFGGSEIGRAYDPSEFTGDNGVSALWEVSYNTLSLWEKANLTPFAYYDIGKVWNKDRGLKSKSAASVGLGLRFQHENGWQANLALAQPLKRPITTPASYQNGKNIRVLMDVSRRF